jgi:hypothetical protein
VYTAGGRQRHQQKERGAAEAHEPSLLLQQPVLQMPFANVADKRFGTVLAQNVEQRTVAAVKLDAVVADATASTLRMHLAAPAAAVTSVSSLKAQQCGYWAAQGQQLLSI